MATAYMMVTPAQPVSGGQSVGEYGVQSNCVTCHGMANFGGSQTGLGYGTDFYIGRDDAAFVGSVQTDFLWSIPNTAD